MMLFVVLGIVVFMALAVVGVLFFMLGKEEKKPEEKDVPKGVLLKQPISYTTNDGSEIIPAFVPKVSLPVQDTKIALENEAYQNRIKELEDQLNGISQKAEGQSVDAKRMIEDLKKENDTLKIQQTNLMQAKEKLDLLTQEASDLKNVNSTLQTQLETASGQVRLLEEQMTAVKLQMGEEISRANATVNELKIERDAALAAPKPEPDEGLKQELETVKIEGAQLRQKYDDLDHTYQKLKELNAHLIEKNGLLQFELTQVRAQTSGLERLSFNYKNQLEEFLKKDRLQQGI